MRAFSPPPSNASIASLKMIKVKRIDHVAIAVADRDAATASLGTLFGLLPGAREHVAGQATDVAFLHPAHSGPADRPAEGDATALEICAPRGNAALDRFLARRGPGLHHVCFAVDDLPGALAELKAAGVRLIDETPRPGARGHQVAFLHPASTGGVLFELCAGSDA
ncbi:MAG TPA: VOC family protein [Polyangia bacterium]|nr:VOC family protein [Polyangia bacterium]